MSYFNPFSPIIKILGSGAVLAAIPASIAIVPKYLPPHDDYRWVMTGEVATECSAPDSNYTVEPIPVLQCTVAQEKTVAICWDGKGYMNSKGGKGCAYKPLNKDQCMSGAANGVLWECKDTTNR